MQSCLEVIQILLSKTEQLMADQTYNANESGLIYNMLFSKTLASKLKDSDKGYKKSMDLLTKISYSNASGDSSSFNRKIQKTVH